MAARIIDACSLINLYATGREESIFEVLGGFYVSKQVQAEALGIRKVDDQSTHGESTKGKSTRLVPEKIELENAIASGLILPCQFDGHDEVYSFVQFAMNLDDGEASCLAIAKSRGWAVASDDRKARRIASENDIALTSTPELMRAWVNATSPSQSSAAEVLGRIERFARFRPLRTDPLHGWWIDLIASDDVA